MGIRGYFIVRLLFCLFSFAQQECVQLLTCEFFHLLNLLVLLLDSLVILSDSTLVILDIFMQFVGFSLQFLIFLDDMVVVCIVVGQMVEYNFVRLILTVTLEELTANEIDLVS